MTSPRCDLQVNAINPSPSPRLRSGTRRGELGRVQQLQHRCKCRRVSSPSLSAVRAAVASDCYSLNPIALFGLFSSAINWRITSNIFRIVSSWSRYIFSSSSSLFNIICCVENILLNRVNARIIWIFTVIALSLFNTLESMATPCSVKA